ncbi:unnamed protein product [Caenorhabditis auriculariae]|uniref:Uncharacterized protein n=1 Tax=Caenorhabditis auriculariae TaxID=2777116 RepID=A0A8S1GQ15_9PELO|nr:unnamed protein product [Caenorhabditis auriculariae]
MIRADVKAKAVFLGDSGVGKTSIILRNDGRPFQATYSATLGANFVVCTIKVGDSSVELQMWDTAGQERFRSMVPMYLRNSRVVFLVYDITDRKTFRNLDSWATDADRANTSNDFKFVVLGNKSDLAKQRRVTTEEGQRFADSIHALFFETSALQDTGIATAVTKLAQSLVISEAEKKSPPHFDGHEDDDAPLDATPATFGCCFS